MKAEEYFRSMADEELFEIIEGYQLETIPYEHPIRAAAHVIHGKEDVISIIGIAVPLLIVIAERLKQTK